MRTHSPHRPLKANIAILLRLSSSLHRDRLVGIFNELGPTDDWNIHFLSDEAELRRTLSGEGFPADGIFSFMPREDETRDALVASTVPLVAFGIDGELERRRQTSARYLHNDSAAIGRLACDFFTHLGNFAAFAFIDDKAMRPWSLARGAAFAAALARRKRDCLTYAPAGSGEAEIKSLGAFLRSLAKPAAVLTAHDERAIDVLRAAREAGCRVPGDLSVLGVDDDGLLCEHARPRLSSIRLNAVAAGERAVAEMREMLASRSATPFKSITLGDRLKIVERETTHGLTPSRQLIGRATAFIRANACRGITPDDVARNLGISRRLLDLRFRQYGEKTVLGCINDVRLGEVKRLLVTTDRPICQIFEAAGYRDTNYANHLFKAATGMTPTAYRAHFPRPHSRKEFPQ